MTLLALLCPFAANHALAQCGVCAPAKFSQINATGELTFAFTAGTGAMGDPNTPGSKANRFLAGMTMLNGSLGARNSVRFTSVQGPSSDPRIKIVIEPLDNGDGTPDLETIARNTVGSDGSSVLTVNQRKIDSTNPEDYYIVGGHETLHNLGYGNVGSREDPTLCGGQTLAYYTLSGMADSPQAPENCRIRADYPRPRDPGCGQMEENWCIIRDGEWDPENCMCIFTPVMINPSNASFRLSGRADGVDFDIDGDGVKERVPWPVAGAGPGLLALDRDGDGLITNGRELFGNVTERGPGGPRNGFAALALWDSPERGGNGDGVIGSEDEVYHRLRLWTDFNHDGVSQPNELSDLTTAGIMTIATTYEANGRRDGDGSQFRYRARWWDLQGHPHWAWDVYLAVSSWPSR
jgi:hypothetical protein